MSKIAIIVSSHIRYNKQFMYLKRCIKSLLNQTYKSDILLSVSFKNEYYKNRFYEEIKSKFQSVIYYECNERKSQFEHYDNLKNNIDKYDYISFCEDDDYYRKNRVKKLLSSILKMNNKNNIDYIGCSERNFKQPRIKNFLVGYVSYMLKPIVFKTFFNTLYENHMEKYLKNHHCYTLFSNYLQIILWNTRKMYYFTVYDNYYILECYNKHTQINVCELK